MKRALVLGGGGSKGAYELGVWKALDELGMSFDIVTGTSIGAIIGALYVQKQYERCLALWERLAVDPIVAKGVDLDWDIRHILAQKKQYTALLKGYGKHMGADSSPFEQLLRDFFDTERFFSSDIEYGCMCVNVTRKQAFFVTRSEMKKETALSYIIASASCFPLFPMKSIDKELYVDGGYADNVPIALARRMGAEEIVAVDVKAIGRKNIHHPQKNLIYIEPHVSLGSFLRFNRERIHRNRILGYQDTMKKFQQYLGSIYTFLLKDKADIITFEEQMHRYIQRECCLYEKTKRQTVKYILCEHLSKRLALQKEYAFPCLRMLEMTAFAFQMDAVGIKSFQQLAAWVQNEAQDTNGFWKHILSRKRHIQQACMSLRHIGSKVLITSIYDAMCHGDAVSCCKLKAMAWLMRDAFAMSAFVYVMKELASIPKEKDFPDESPSFLK